jgi:hypothetical protein
VRTPERDSRPWIERRLGGDGGFAQAHLGDEQAHIDPGQDRHGIGPVCLDEAAHGVHQPFAHRLLAGGVGHQPGLGRRRGGDGLGNPAPVVGEEDRGGVDDRGGAAVVDLEGVLGGSGEVAAVVDQEVGGGAGIPVDDLVVVAHTEDVVAGGGQQPDQEEIGRGQVLELVDEQVPAPGLGPPPQAGIRQEGFQGAVDLLVVVDGAHLAEGVAVAVEDVDESGHVVAGLFDLLGAPQAGPHLRQRLQVGGVDVLVGAGLDRGETVEQSPHLALRQQSGTPTPGVTQDLVAEGVESAHVGGRSRADAGASPRPPGGCRRER